MDEAVINDLADAFRLEFNNIYDSWFGGRVLVKSKKYETQLKDDIDLVALVINKHNPEYNLEDFYERAGYPWVPNDV